MPRAKNYVTGSSLKSERTVKPVCGVALLCTRTTRHCGLVKSLRNAPKRPVEITAMYFLAPPSHQPKAAVLRPKLRELPQLSNRCGHTEDMSF